MIVKNRYSIRLGKGQSNNQGRSIVTNPKRKETISNVPPPPVGSLLFNGPNQFLQFVLIESIGDMLSLWQAGIFKKRK